MSESPKKSPRQRFREEHAQFLERLSAGLTDLEIMRQMAWNKFSSSAIWPEDIRRLFPDASPDALLKIETDVSGFIASLM